MNKKMFNEKSNLNDIVLNGTFYYPANKHYDYRTSVICDYCFKSDLKCCVGYNQKDLCLTCVENIINNNNNNNIPMLSRITTNMMQDSVRKDDNNIYKSEVPEFIQNSMNKNEYIPKSYESHYASAYAKYNNNEIKFLTRMMQDSVRKNDIERPRTKMMQDSVRKYSDNGGNLTFMMQDSVR